MTRMGRICAGALCALVMSGAMAQASAPKGKPAPALVSYETQAAQHIARWLGALLALPPDLPIDDDLRAEAEAIAKAHAARMNPVFVAWATEERAQIDPSRFPGQLATNMEARYVNEVALWRLDSAGAQHDAAILPALLWPGRCPLAHDRSLFARQMLIVQQVPRAQRALVLAGERELLGRWGKPRAALPARPVPSLAELEEQSIARMLESDWLPEVPLPPVLASTLLTRERKPGGDSVLCATHQWWLRRTLALQPSEQAASLIAWRYASLPDGARWLVSDDRLKGKTPADYPPFAAQFGIEGKVLVDVVLDPRGHIASTRIAGRELTVNGVRGIRPVAFETSLDEASIARVRLPDIASAFKPDPSKPQTLVRVPVGWKLQ
jgi:hypothetical protein